MKKNINIFISAIYFISYNSMASQKRPSFEDIQMNWYLKRPQESFQPTEKQASLAQRLAHWWYDGATGTQSEQESALSLCQTKLKNLLQQINVAKINEAKWKKKYETLKKENSSLVVPRIITEGGQTPEKKSAQQRDNRERVIEAYIEASLNYLNQYPQAEAKYTFTITGAQKNDLPKDQIIDYLDKDQKNKIAIFTLHQNQMQPTQFTLTGKLVRKKQQK